MAKRPNLRPQLKPISKPALKLLWMLRKRKHPSLSFRRSSTPDGCAAVLSGHEDIVFEILARLPVKSLMRFRSVCTTWRSLISDPHFIKKHMKYDAERGLKDKDIRLLFSMKPPSTMGLADLKGAKLDLKPFREDRVAIRELEFPVCLDFVKGVVNIGSCNGIICVHFRADFVLWNPCTGEHNVLPKPKGVSCYAQYYGFGYDEINDDYKVVKGSYSEYDEEGVRKAVVQVFSLRRGTWNTYPGPRNSCMFLDRLVMANSYMRRQGACVNGVLHWLRFEECNHAESKEIMPFSLAEEKFLEAMPLSYECCGVFVSGNCLCAYSDRAHVRILMMKEYGVQESWTEVLYITYHTVPEIYDEICVVKPLWILENGDVLAYTVQRGGYLSVYKSKDKAFGNVIRPEGSYDFEAVTYRETLVSPITGSPKDI